MLKLESLELSGFKSFPDPVDLHLAGGITAIVGPNGCGKSNLSEAITWVLGEQSAKSLRGGKMEDVIFGGSQQRKPLGMAEATLTLATDDPSASHAEDGRITIGRRVFRSGESQYRMNGKTVRMKDIKDLLMDTGLGIRAYSVIEQGKIGMILSGKPQERRKLIEEAAGITRYKARKRIAEMKLEEATANLLRLEDVVSEVERSLRSLKRQASAARRYQKKQTEYRELLWRVLTARYRALVERLEELEARLAAAGDRETALATELARDEAALAAGRQTLDRFAEELARRHQHQADLAATIEGRQEYIKGTRRTLEEITERSGQNRTTASRRRRELEELEERLAEHRERRAEVARELEAASSEVTEDEENIAAAERTLKQAQSRVESLRRELLGQGSEISRIQERQHEAQIEAERATYRKSRLDAEISEHGEELAKAGEAVEEARARVTELHGAIEAKQGEIDRIAEALETTLRRESEASEGKRRLEDELSENRQRHRLLEELSRAHEERRQRLEEALDAAGLDSPEFLAERLSPVEGWERSLDFFLAELTDAVMLGAGRAGEGLELAGSLADGGARALLLTPLESLPEGFPVVDDPAVALSLAEALGLEEGVAAALPPAYLVEDAASAERLARRHPGIAFISRDGIWAEGGALHVEGGEASPGVLERERELGELAEVLPRLEEDLAAAGAELERQVTRRSELAREKNHAEGELGQLKQELAVAEARREDLIQRHRRLEEDNEELLAERREVDEEIERTAEAKRSLEAEHREADSAHSGLQERLDRATAEVEAAQAERESLRTASADRRGRLQLLEERLATHDRETERLEREIEEGRTQIAAWKEEADRLERRQTELETGLERAEQELQEALTKRTASQGEVTAAQERLDQHRRELDDLEGRIAQTRERRDEVRSELEELKVERASLHQDRNHMVTTFRDEFDRELTPELASAPPEGVEAEDGEPVDAAADDEGEPETLSDLETRLAETKAALERLGPVNVLAVEEYAEQEERHDFLLEQRADVEESVESLKKTIREINRTSSERFRTTFEAVNQHFGEVFSRLFRGGEAEMRLLDEEDILETGIEIVARPPGKRLQNIMLLSGGEKALTAIALLFALFKTKPSPFCVLDEVDAPLDDVNTVRFVELLCEMSGETQFLIITHNKITMEAATTLYGVTMEEKGVSKLVSVEMEEVQPEEEEAKTA